MAAQKQRQSNIELFRIITMLLIVAHHYVVNSGVMDFISKHPAGAKSLFYLLFGAWGKTGINCFVLITGYFMCQSHLTVKKYLKLLLEIYFYRFTIYVVFVAFGLRTVSVRSILFMLLPFSSIADGFTSCFMAFYLFIPFLNIAIAAMNRKHHGLLIGLLLLIYTVLATIPSINVAFNYVTWFIVLYFIGSYLRLYDVKWVNIHSGRKLLLVLAASVASIVLFAFYAEIKGMDGHAAFYLLSDSNKPFALLVAVFAFSYFRQLNIGYRSWINKIAATTFGVLLIHANSDTMRTWLWRTVLHNREMFASPFAVPHAFLSVIGVFAICVLIDRARIAFVETPFFRWYDSKEDQMKAGILKNFAKLIKNTNA